MKEILITGGNGKTGRKVVERLLELNEAVKIGSRKASPAFDWYNDETWNAVLENVEKVYIAFQPDLAVPGTKEIITKFVKKSVNAGVTKFVLLSGKGEREAELCEDIVKNSGVNWTIVRASWFNQNFSEEFFLDPILSGTVALPNAEISVPFIDTDDIADVVVEALLKDSHNYQTYELTGPRKLKFEEVIQEISRSTNRDIKFIPVTIEQYSDQLRKMSVPEDYIWLIQYLFTEVLTQENSIVTNDVEKVLGRKAKDFVDYVSETAPTGVWNQSITESV